MRARGIELARRLPDEESPAGPAPFVVYGPPPTEE